MLSNDKPIRIRSSDRTDCEKTCERIAVVERQVAEMTTAFVLNDLGKPDYDGHRKAHITLIDAAKIIEGYKLTATTKIIGAVIGFIVLLLSTGLTTKLAEVLK